MLLKTRNQRYAITPKHCLKNLGYTVEQTLIPYSASSNVFLPIDVVSHVVTELRDDDDHADVVIFRVWSEKFRPERGIGCAAKSDYTLRLLRFPTTELLVVGFPKAFGWVDYDKESIKQRRTILKAKHLQRNRFRGIDEIEFRTHEDLSSFDGLSGSAVISVHTMGDRKVAADFEGILLRATRESMRGFFLRREYLHSYLLRVQTKKRDVLS